MRAITKAHIKRASERYPEAKSALESWYKIMVASKIGNFAELKKIFRSVDTVGRVVVFNIKGNSYRLIAAIHYNTKLVYVLEVITHAKYDEDTWKSRYKVYN